ncbi:MAG: MbcA/ParS/Xre antitoxin family protein, partial [Bryobacteraceae bacterium]
QLNGADLAGSPILVNDHSGRVASSSPDTARLQRTKGQAHKQRRAFPSKLQLPVAASVASGHKQEPSRPQVHLTTAETPSVDLDDIVTVTARAIEVFGSREKALRWLRTPVPSLSDRTPLSVLNTAYGIEHIEEVLGRIEQGVW